MLVGLFYREIDVGGRVTIPSKWREELGEDPVILKCFNGKCLSIFPKEVLMKIESSALMRSSDYDLMSFKRWFLSTAVKVDIDSRGRIRIPKSLLELSGIEKSIVLVGLPERIEVWSKRDWNKCYSEADFFLG